ncbi:3-oxoacyl-ACP synthase [Zunongwangia sp. SCSIO 43204]|uniref:3-oxoacyl-ACP synthase n=1 Tax=Zunongwangia sp. SCSIO 43204 TaxID=2779359 RepID=UPI001CAA240A|nr:3-oxoacyl-ACP synthase [Zunongwangia sp. SCSIO 43204]UAB83494.1 3-oxoacyl-ACP synthase [Zunongwangia sp. SCSIO 43204]
MANLGVEHWVRIKNGRIILDGEVIFSSEENIARFLKASFKFLNIKYPKFHKMDRLSKLGFIASEIVLKNNNIDEETALVFSNNSSSLDSDQNYQESVKDFPSPSLFVYTLPNIVLGEISIRYQLKSENVFFIEDEFNANLLIDYSKQLIESKKANKVLCAWLNLHNDEYDVFLWLSSESHKKEASEEQIRKIYDADYD